MRKSLLLVLITLVIISMFVHKGYAQTTKTVGNSGADYSSLKLAFDAINDGTLTGSITLKIIDNTTETVTANLNASGYIANYTSVNIYPTVSGLSINGDLNEAVIHFTGANNVIIDGRVNGTDSSGGNLTIINYNTTGWVGSATTISFTDDARYNTIKYCTVRGSYSPNGVILFYGTTGSNGNSNNTIDRNYITNVDDTHRPGIGIYSYGAPWAYNSSNTISNNNIYNIISLTLGGSSIYANQNSTGWTITGNSLYESNAMSSASGITVDEIFVASGGNHTVSGNFIGGSSARCGGSPWTKTGTGAWNFNGIRIQPEGTNSCTIQGNTIKNLSISGLDKFKAINAGSGSVNIGNITPNIIGANTGNSSIVLGGKYVPGYFYGIYIGSGVSGTVNVSNNIIGAVTSSIDTVTCSFCGIYDNSVGSSTTILSNTIGSTDAGTTGSINMASTGKSFAQSVYGINSGYSGRSTVVTISGNTVSKLTNGTTNSSTSLMGQIFGIRIANGKITVQNNTVRDLTIANAYNKPVEKTSDSVSVCGISYCNGTESYAQTVSGNTIYNLSNSYSTFAGRVLGLYFFGALGPTNVVTKNFIYGLSVTGASSTGASIEGMTLMNTSETSNNVISLTGNTRTTMSGIQCFLSNFLYFNTVYIGGSLAAGATNRSFSVVGDGYILYMYLKNNILVNARSTAGGSALHFAAYFSFNSPYVAIDDNDYYVSGTGGMLGHWYGTNKPSLPLNTGTDTKSLAVNPLLANAGGTSAVDYKPSNGYLLGATGTGVTVDYTGTTRSTTAPSMGAYEYPVTGKVSVTATSGITTGNYFTLKDAFDAINNGTHKGTITIKINLNTTETSSAVLYQSGYGSVSSYSSITVYPTDTGLSVSGSFAAPLVDLNGADNITIDGRVNASGTTRSLVISNTSTSDTSGTSTIRFINDASSNTVSYCTVKGSSTSAADGIIVFGTTTGSTGNDNNTINNNNITCSSNSYRPYNSVYSLGTSSFDNSGNTISNNNIYDFLNGNSVTSSYGIYIGSYSTSFTVTGNSFYETTSYAPSGNGSFYAVYIGNTSGTGFTVSGNYIGGSSVSCGGTAWTKTNANYNNFYGIYVSAGTGTASSIQGNTIKNINLSNSSTAAASFYGIDVEAGDINIGTATSNTIGASTGTGSVTLTNGATGGSVYAINISGSGTVSCQNNVIGSITTSTSTGTLACGFSGITISGTGTTTISSNLIGSSTTANSINAGSSSTGNTQSVYGIYCTRTGANTLDGNTIANLTNATTNTSGGIIAGMYYSGSTSSTVSKNFIISLFAGTSSTATSIYGVQIAAGTTTYSNNIISLGGNTASPIYGIYETGASGNNNSLYFNTVYLNGAPASSSQNSFCLYGAASTNTRNFRNNIFANARSNNGATGTHYCVYLNYGVSTGLTLGYNDYYAPGTGGVIGRYNSANVTSLPVVTGLDGGSLMDNPNFASPGGTTAANYLPSAQNLLGITGSGITTDYIGTSRSTTAPSIGAFEYSITAKITVSSTSGTVTGSYSTLKDAFDAVNAGTHLGVITITVNAGTNEAASAVLYSSGTGSSSYTSLSIYPTTTGLSISGSLASPLIDLNGADNVTIDGRVNATGSAKDLIITNTSTASTSGTSTIRFINDASSNTVKYCTVKGSSTSMADGIIVFSTTTGSSGNDNNTINNNNITCSSNSYRPYNSVYSLGTSSKDNSGNTISNNSIYDFINGTSTISSYGIYIGSYSTSFTVTGNSFYETTSYAPSGNGSFYTVYISNTSGTGFTVSGNYIGGSSVSCGGTAWTKTNANYNNFYGIYVSAGTGTASSIQGNIIQNISCSNSLSSSFYGIYAAAGDLNIGTTSANTIGASTGTGSITLTNGASSGIFYGIILTSSGTVSCQNNVIGSVTTAASTGTLNCNFYGIKQSGSGTSTISGNMIGSTATSSSINASSESTANVQTVYGIYSTGTGTVTISVNTTANMTNGTMYTSTSAAGLINGIYSGGGTCTISGNTVRNLAISNANTANSVSASVTGIVLNNTTTAAQTITANTIYNLNNNYVSFAGYINGIYYAGPTTSSTVSRNYIYGLTASSSASSNICGIRISTGFTKYTNNIIFLGDNNQATVTGIYEYGSSTSNNNSIYFNTIYIAGTVSSGTLNSYALYSSATTNIRNIRGNIFFNARSNSGASGNHYAAYFNYATTTNLTLELNDYYTTGTGGCLGYYNSANVSSLPLIATLDVNSKNANPSFANAGGTAATDYIPSNTSLNGPTGGTSVYVDYTNTSRVYYSMGAFDYAATSGIITVTATSGTSSASYSYLKDAFDAINAGTHKGTITILVNSNTNENSPAVLYYSGYSGSSYTSINMYPTVTGLSVSGSLGSPLIVLDGADNVTIDGRVNATGSTKDLIISNTSTSSATGTSTIRFIDDATSNTVKYCTIKGSTTSTSNGIVDFGTTTGTTGNDNNTIYNNNITSASDANRPFNAIYSAGTSTKENSGNTISSNNIFDFLNRGYASNGINLNLYTTAFTITGNSFYETATFIPSASASYNIIYSTNSGSNFIISNNSIGGSAPSCGGSAWTKTGANDNPFNAIFLNTLSGTASSIQGNTINNFDYTNSSSGTWTGINVAGHTVNIGTSSGNTIGSVSSELVKKSTDRKTRTDGKVKDKRETNTSIKKSNNAEMKDEPLTSYGITFTAGATGANFYGVSISSTGTVYCKNTIISSITAANSNSAYATNFYGIYKASVSGSTFIQSNTVGSSSVSSSIYVSSASSSNAQSVYGIYNSGLGQMEVTGNTIGNLTNATSNTNTSAAGVIDGIFSNSGAMIITDNTVSYLSIANANNNSLNTASVAGITSTSNATLSGNVVKNLSNTFPSFTGSVIGVYNGNTCTASRTFVKALSVGSSSGASVYGIKINAGTSTYSNNIIILGDDTPVTFYGIYETGASGTNSLYFNTVYITGSPTEGTLNSYALYSAVSTNTRNFRNNIFVNARSNNGASGTHYAAYFAYAVSTNLTLNYNDYYVTGTGGVLGYYNSSNVISIPLIASMDANSKNADPGFSNPGGTLSTDYVASNANLAGISGTGITVDYLNNTRQYNSMGAFDYAVSMQICVIATTGVTLSNYSTFKEAIDAINAGTHKGSITIKLYVSSSESASVVLNASGSGSASYSTINIYPMADSLSISGSISSPLIDLNGADNVTIDGRVNASGSSQSLTIENRNINYPTIRIYNGSDNNTVKYSVLKGSENQSSLGLVTIGTTGSNNSNQIINNKITNSGNSKPYNSVYISTTTTSVYNNANKIENNEIFDNFSAGGGSAVNVGQQSTNTSVKDNSIYSTNTILTNSGNTYFYGIFVYGAYANSTEISGNYIGGTQANALGSYFYVDNGGNTSNGAYFHPIHVSGGDNASPTSVQGNIIRKIKVRSIANTSTNNYSNPHDDGYMFAGIFITAGANVGTVTPNIIGDPTGTSSIVAVNIFSSERWSGGIVIRTTGDVNVNVKGNVIAGLTADGNSSSSSARDLVGICESSNPGGSTYQHVIENNIIGSESVSNSLQSASNTYGGSSGSETNYIVGIFVWNKYNCIVRNNIISNLSNNTTVQNNYTCTYGIWTYTYFTNSLPVGTTQLENNTIKNLYNYAGGIWYNYSSVCGIYNNSTSNTRVAGNTIFGLNNLSTVTSSNDYVMGISSNGSTSTSQSISGNIIYGLSFADNSSTTEIRGINHAGGTTSYFNNIIILSGNTKTTICGIYDVGSSSNNSNIYYNTVYIDGTLTSGATNRSYGIFSYNPNNVRDYRNNIFCNARSTTGGSNLHYAAYFNYSVNTNLTLNYNSYYASGTGGVFGYYAGTNKTSLPIVTGLDVNSTVANPIFTNAGGTNSECYYTGGPLTGTAISGITTDYKGDSRSETPRIGALEGYVWKGSVSTDYNNSANWLSGTVPGTNSTVVFDANPLNHCILDGDRTLASIVNNQSTYYLDLNGKTLTLKNNIELNNGAKIKADGSGSILVFSGTMAQSISSGTVFENNAVNNLTLNNSYGLTTNTSFKLNNLLTLTSGLLTLGGSANLTLGESSTISGTPSTLNMIVPSGTGELRKVLTGTGSFTFPVGDNSGTVEYTPATLNFTSGTFSSAYAGIKLTNSKHSNNTSSTDYLNRYWSVSQSGISSFTCNVTFQYLPADVTGTEANIWGGKYSGGGWMLLNQADAQNHRLTGTVTGFSDFTGGQDNALPVTLSSFTSSVNARDVILNWVTTSEINNSGFEVEKSENGEWRKAGYIQGKGTTNIPTHYSFEEKKLSTGKYKYRLKQIDNNGNFEYFELDGIVEIGVPTKYELSQNYPNPFNPMTKIDFQLPTDGKVTLKIYDITGREMATLVNNEFKKSDYYTVLFNGSNLSSGVYFYRIIADKFVMTKKMVLVK